MTCSRLIFRLFKTPYRSGIQQQPFLDYSSLFYSHCLLRTARKTQHNEQKRPTSKTMSHMFKCFSKTYQPFPSEWQVQFAMVFQDALANQRKSRDICLFIKPIIWKSQQTIGKYFRKMSTNNLGKSWKVCLDL